MAELADALDLGSSSERSTGSIPATRTKNEEKRWLKIDMNPKSWTTNWRGFYHEMDKRRKAQDGA